MTKIETIHVGFRAIDDIIVIRGKWYSGSFMNSDRFRQWLIENPEYISKLRNIITSVVVGRGLTLKLNFSSAIRQESWRELATKGKGGLTIAGWKFGLRSRYSSKTKWELTNLTETSVSFSDAPDVCRVLGLKVEDVFPDLPDSSNFTVHSDSGIAALEQFTEGSINYGELIDSLNKVN